MHPVSCGDHPPQSDHHSLVHDDTTCEGAQASPRYKLMPQPKRNQAQPWKQPPCSSSPFNPKQTPRSLGTSTT
jgi:hypothetical protein